MPGGYGTSGPWGSAGDSYTTTGTTGGFAGSGITSGSGSGSGNDNTGVNDINTVTNEPIVVDEINTFSTKPEHLSNIDDNIWELAIQAYASNPGYAKSWEGQKLIKQLAESGITQGDPQYEAAMVQAFGLPQIVATGTNSWGNPIYTDDGNVIMSGQGQHLLDNYNNPTGTYQEKVDDYYAIRDAEMAQQTGGDQGYGYDYGSSGGGGGGGYPMGAYAPAHRKHQAFLDQLYKGRLAGGKEVHKMLAMNQKIEAANILSGLSQDAQAFAMDPKARGILAVLQA